MRRVFSRWGKVEDLFIPTRRNLASLRFGFVRFIGVTNPESLVRRIDQTFIGNMKLFVNVPKYIKYSEGRKRSA